MLTFVGAYEDRRSPPRSAASCCARARSSTSTTGCSPSRRRRRRIRELVPEARVADAHGQMGEHQLEQVMLDFWEKRARRAGLHHDRRVRPRHLQRQHADHRARRPARPLPAAPAARSGRPRPGARLRLLPLPAGEAAHRDRPRAARHHRRAHRPRRRHGGRDEGPRDPRRRQPARRRAVRAHRRRRLRPLRPAGRRGGRGVPRRRPRAARREVRIELPIDAHLPTRLHRASGCGWRCTSGWPRSAATPTSPVSPRSCEDRYGPMPEPVQTLLAVARFRVLARSLGLTRGRLAGELHPLRAGRAARVAPAPAEAALSRLGDQGRREAHPGAPAARPDCRWPAPPGRRAARRGAPPS